MHLHVNSDHVYVIVNNSSYVSQLIIILQRGKTLFSVFSEAISLFFPLLRSHCKATDLQVSVKEYNRKKGGKVPNKLFIILVEFIVQLILLTSYMR